MAWDSATLRAKDAEDLATMVERESLEWVSRAEVVNSMVLASACEDVDGFVWKIILPEGKLVVECQAWKESKRDYQEQFEELTLLQTRAPTGEASLVREDAACDPPP
jgi:hypothetical protein